MVTVFLVSMVVSLLFAGVMQLSSKSGIKALRQHVDEMAEKAKGDRDVCLGI